RDRVSVEHQLLAEDIAAAGEARLPVTVAQHGLRMAALIQVVLCGEGASQRSADAEYGEVIAAYELARDQFGLSLIAHAECGAVAAEHALEDSVLVAKVLIHRVGDGIAPGIAAVMASSRGEQHEFLRIADRQKLQNDLVDQAEDRGVGANAEG